MSLWAAHLPGVDVFPFSTGQANSLPQLPPGVWKRLVESAAEQVATSPPPDDERIGDPILPGTLRWGGGVEVGDSAAGSGSRRHRRRPLSTAMLLFSPPHFPEVERLMQRMAAVLPKGTQVRGWSGFDVSATGLVLGM